MCAYGFIHSETDSGMPLKSLCPSVRPDTSKYHFITNDECIILHLL